MRDWTAERVALAAGGTLLGEPPARGGPSRVVIDSRELAPGELFVGLPGEREDGGAHAAEALAAGAWGVLVGAEHGERLRGSQRGAVIVHEDPLSGLQGLATAWRRELGARVVAITGSTGKTSTKDILAALLDPHLRVVASPENFNTEIGMPLAVLAAPAGTQALVLEMAMRGAGQVAALTVIAEPDVGVITNVGPVHLQTLGSLEAIAAAKAELIAGLAPAASVVVPAGERLLAPHLRADLRTITFGEGADVELAAKEPGGGVVITDSTPSALERPVSIRLRPSFTQAHNLGNLVAAVAAARALGVTPEGELRVRFSALRGQRRVLRGGVVLIDDCYNANPMSMRAAIDDLTDTAPGRRVAVLGDMLELGPDSPRFHREIGEYAAGRGVSLLVTVGTLAGEIGTAFGGEAHHAEDAPAAVELLRGLLHEGDTVLVKGSRGVGLERVAEGLSADGPLDQQAGVLLPPVAPGRR